jgi:hypothetical protein
MLCVTGYYYGQFTLQVESEPPVRGSLFRPDPKSQVRRNASDMFL